MGLLLRVVLSPRLPTCLINEVTAELILAQGNFPVSQITRHNSRAACHAGATTF
jgi:hypothetical protein